MGAEKAITIGVAVVIAVMIAGAMLMIFKQGNGFINKGLSQAADLSSKFNDVDKQKYDGMTCMGDSVVDAINDYWDDTTCEVVVCTLDGVNAVYNKEATDGTYKTPFEEVLTGMPTTDCKGRAFPADATIYQLPSGIAPTSVQNANAGNIETYDVTAVANANVTDGAASGPAFLVDAAKLVQNPTGTPAILATASGYNEGLALGSGGYISSSASFVGSIQKDANGAIRRITFVQK